MSMLNPNFKSLFLKYKIDQKLEIDSEILPALINYYLEKNYDLNEAIYKILEENKTSLCTNAMICFGMML